MSKTRYALLCSAMAALVVSSSALAAPPTQDAQYSGTAIITDNNDLLEHDGDSTYGPPHSNIFVSDEPDGSSAEDLFALYVSKRRIFSLSFDDRRYPCGGASHVFFQSPSWWEQTDEPGKTALGSVGIWCDQGNNTAYAVRYPGFPRDPATDGSADCVVATRGEDVDGGRQYRFATPDATPTTEPHNDPIEELLSGGSGEEPTAEAGCPAKVFYVTDVNNHQRASTLEWEGEAAFEILTTLTAPKSRGPGK